MMKFLGVASRRARRWALLTKTSQVLARYRRPIRSAHILTPDYGILITAILFGLSHASLAKAENYSTFGDIETKYIFGFTEGSGIGLEGEKEFSPESVVNIGKRDGSYVVSQTKLEYEFTPNQYIQIELGPVVSTYNIQNVTGLDNMNTAKFSGFFGEFRYLLLERSASSPLSMTLSVEPEWNAFDGTTGARVVNYGLETKINADLELIPNRLFLGSNLLYEPETTRGDLGAWQNESTFGISGALAFRPIPQLLIGTELDYLRHYEGIGFNSFTGDALYLGPTFFVQLKPHVFLAGAFGTQVAGHEIGQTGAFDLTDFSRNRAKLKLGVEF